MAHPKKLTPPICSYEGCTEPGTRKGGICKRHYDAEYHRQNDTAKGGHRGHTSWICEECSAIFTLHVPTRKKKVFCPLCGDHIEVSRYTAKWKSPDTATKPRWTEQEKDLLRRIITGDLSAVQVALQIGRTRNSVSKAVKRLQEGKL